MESEGSLPHVQVPTICSYPETFELVQWSLKAEHSEVHHKHY